MPYVFMSPRKLMNFPTLFTIATPIVVASNYWAGTAPMPSPCCSR